MASRSSAIQREGWQAGQQAQGVTRPKWQAQQGSLDSRPEWQARGVTRPEWQAQQGSLGSRLRVTRPGQQV